MLHWCRCPQSSSCRARTARSRSTSCNPSSSTRQQGMECMPLWSRCPQSKSCPLRTLHYRWRLRCPPGSTCRQGTRCMTHCCRCPQSSSCLQDTSHYPSTHCILQDRTRQQGTPNRLRQTSTRRPCYTFPRGKACMLHWCHCPPWSSCRRDKARCRLTTSSPSSSTRPQDKQRKAR